MKSPLIVFALCLLFTVFATASASLMYAPRQAIKRADEWRVARASIMEHHFVKRDGENNGTTATDSNVDNTNSPNDPPVYAGEPVAASYVVPDDPENKNLIAEQNEEAENRKKTNSSTPSGNGVGAKITFFEGQMLKNAFCYGDGKLPAYDAKPTDMIGAMRMIGKSMCYKCVEIKCGSKSTIVKIIDACATCGSRDDIDLTLEAFKQLAPPVKGIVPITWRPLASCPSDGKWPKFEEKDNKNDNKNDKKNDKN
ncbi:20589_t:CDS:1 [Racocetra persica]|uniref:20589_t:CDS:1 n=1 Tax=Racocetra persica TaxID=160502 RepID=A0ACA9ML92_9GLOM|nr:20589_t:CDS:1 [Racocetra persica]